MGLGCWRSNQIFIWGMGLGPGRVKVQLVKYIGQIRERATKVFLLDRRSGSNNTLGNGAMWVLMNQTVQSSGSTIWYTFGKRRSNNNTPNLNESCIPLDRSVAYFEASTII
jgi:hypothetical protein